jgi:hypothetical protein
MTGGSHGHTLQGQQSTSARIVCLMQFVEQVMAHYRLYVLNDHDKIAEATDIQARDDTHAFEVAERVRNAQPLEIWQGTRLVGRYGRHIV